jgi:integrase
MRVRGHVRYLGEYGTPESRAAYARALAELAVQAPDTPQVIGRGLLVLEVCDRYWTHAQTYYVKPSGEPSGWLSHIHLALHLVRSLYGNTPAEDFGPLALKAIRQTQIGKGHSRGYVNKITSLIPRMFKWAASEQLVPGRVYQDLRTVEGLRKGRCQVRETPPVLPVPDEVVDATLPHLQAVVADMVRFQRLTGCRPGEVCLVRPADIDRSGVVWRYRPLEHKTQHQGRERTVYIGPQAQAILLPYLLRPAESFCFCPAEALDAHREARHAARKTPEHQGNTRGTNRKRRPRRTAGSRYTKDSYRRAVARGCERAFGMPKALRTMPKKASVEQKAEIRRAAAEWRAKHAWHPNQLRHTAATEIRRHAGLEAAQVILGHAKADVTQVYAERDQALAVETIKKIG